MDKEDMQKMSHAAMSSRIPCVTGNTALSRLVTFRDISHFSYVFAVIV
jgi:hypothetical protein